MVSTDVSTNDGLRNEKSKHPPRKTNIALEEVDLVTCLRLSERPMYNVHQVIWTNTVVYKTKAGEGASILRHREIASIEMAQ